MIHRFGGIWIMFKISAAAIKMSELFHLCSIHQQPASVSRVTDYAKNKLHPLSPCILGKTVTTNFKFIPRPPLFSGASPIIPTSFLHSAIRILNWALKFLVIHQWRYPGEDTDMLSRTGSWVITRFWGSVSCAGRVRRFENHTDKARSQLPHLLAVSLEELCYLFPHRQVLICAIPLLLLYRLQKNVLPVNNCSTGSPMASPLPNPMSSPNRLLPWPAGSIWYSGYFLFLKTAFGIADTSSSSKHFFTWSPGLHTLLLPLCFRLPYCSL